MAEKKLYFITDTMMNDLYNLSLDIASKRVSILHQNLKIHDIHRPSLGFWQSTQEMIAKTKAGFELPFIDNALVCPFYNSDHSLGHIRLVYENSKGYKIVTLGPSPHGVFNIMNAQKMFDGKSTTDKEHRLKIVDSLLSALSKDDSIHTDLLSDANLKTIGKITPMLSLHGSQDFIKKWEFVEGFDVKIGKTDLSLTDVCIKNFCFQDLLGLDLRAVIPKAIDYVNTLPVYERKKFNDEFMKIFKVDLRNVAPFLFEHQLSERRLFSLVKDKLNQDFVIHAKEFTNTGLQLSVIHRVSNKKSDMVLNSRMVSQYLSLYYGDLINFCYSKDIGGLPAQYIWQNDMKTRHTRSDTYKAVCELFYMAILDMVKKDA